MMGDSTRAIVFGLKRRKWIENYLEVALVGFSNALNMAGEK